LKKEINMHSIFLRSNLFLLTTLGSTAIALADINDPVVRVEHRPIHQPSYQHGPYYQDQQYHPAAREAARQDVNRAAENNALNNAGNYSGVPQTVPVYPNETPPVLTTPPNPGISSGNNVNVYTVPQSAGPTPQH
jgi:hypothetical protein